ncbi:MAG TPA: mycothiol synthase [Trebonia sp.]|nr:mycothiol synthase [Trebonia sp.]
MTQVSLAVTGDFLPRGTVDKVLSLVTAVHAADGVAPLSEDALYTVGYGGKGVKHLTLTLPDRAVIGYAHLVPAEAGAPNDDGTGELLVSPVYRRRGFGSALAAELVNRAAGRGVRVWAHGDLPAAAAFAKSTGFARVRTLWRLRMSLKDTAIPEPAFPADVTVRTFVPGSDEESWLAVNRRAFAHHPEQGSWSGDDLRLREEEPWFDPAGFFLAERGGQLAGFHWTKVAPRGGENGEPIGEVYVVGVDPSAQGVGLGRALTLAGLAHLRDRGLADVMLYVDEDNAAAIRMYMSLGFTRWSADAMYRNPAVS